MTQEKLLQIGKLGLAIEDGANMVLDMYRVKEELTGADLFKGEPSEDRSHYAGYKKGSKYYCSYKCMRESCK